MRIKFWFVVVGIMLLENEDNDKMWSCRGLKHAINFPGLRSLPCVLPCRGGLWTCVCVYLDAHDSAMKFSTHERTPFLPTLVCAQIANSATGDIRSGCASDDDSSASRSSCSSVRASICGVRSLTNAMKLDSVVSRSRHLGIKCRQARCVSTSEAPIISSIIPVCNFFVFYVLWNFNVCCRCLLCRST
jgi:hypothetical protein